MKAQMMAGNWAFLIGFFGAIILGILAGLEVFTYGTVLTTILIVAGVLIGLLNVTRKEKVPIMLASILIGSGAGVLASLEFVGVFLSSILQALAYVAVPAGIIVAFTTFMNRAK